MAKGDYPLKTALELRANAEKQAKVELSQALTALQAAEDELGRLDQAIEQHRRETERFSKAQVANEDQGGAVDALLRGQQHLRARATELAKLQDERNAASERVLEAQNASEAAREALAKRQAEHKAVVRHHERFKQTQRQKALNREELESEDVISGRRK